MRVVCQDVLILKGATRGLVEVDLQLNCPIVKAEKLGKVFGSCRFVHQIFYIKEPFGPQKRHVQISGGANEIFHLGFGVNVLFEQHVAVLGRLENRMKLLEVLEINLVQGIPSA